jgi:hypothetical protein
MLEWRVAVAGVSGLNSAGSNLVFGNAFLLASDMCLQFDDKLRAGRSVVFDSYSTAMFRNNVAHNREPQTGSAILR